METKTIKPIKTTYKGIPFRSRLEARWAVFFDEMGIEYTYEARPFTMRYGIRYLPDFTLTNVHWRGEYAEHYTGKPGQPVYVEIKGADFWDEIRSSDERTKIELFAQSSPMLVLGNLPYDLDKAMEEHTSDGIMSFKYLDGDTRSCFFSRYSGEVWLAGLDDEEYQPNTVACALSIARMARFDSTDQQTISKDSISLFSDTCEETPW